MESSPIFSLHAACCWGERIPHHLRKDGRTAKVINRQYSPHDTWARSCLSRSILEVIRATLFLFFVEDDWVAVDALPRDACMFVASPSKPSTKYDRPVSLIGFSGISSFNSKLLMGLLPVVDGSTSTVGDIAVCLL